MRRIFMLALLSAGALVAFSAVPVALYEPGAAGLEASAAASIKGTKSVNLRKTH